MKSKFSVLHLTVPNKPPFLIHGHHSHKIWHRVILHSSKRHENAKTKKSYRQRFCPSLCALLFLLFSCFKDICSLLNYRESQFCWGTGNTFSPTEPWSCCCFLSTSPSWPGVEHGSTVSLRFWDASWKSGGSKSWNLVYFYFTLLFCSFSCLWCVLPSWSPVLAPSVSLELPQSAQIIPTPFGCFFQFQPFPRAKFILEKSQFPFTAPLLNHNPIFDLWAFFFLCFCLSSL